MITIEDFNKLDIRVGRILEVELLPSAKYTTHKLTIDFGEEIGRKISCARLVRYKKEELAGRLILGVVNLPPRQIGSAVSEVLTLGVPDEDGECVLIKPDKEIKLGGKLY